MFRRLELPTPFRVGTVNAYLAGRTLVDPGPASEEAWAALLSALETEELAAGDISRVLVTHPHPAHFGLARRLRAEGAAILASPEAASIIADFPRRYEYEREYFAEWFPRHGMAEKAARSATRLAEAYLDYAPNATVDQELESGDVIVVDDSELGALAVEGHAAGERIFAYDADGQRRAIVGDHVLAHEASVPLLQPPAEPGGERPRVLPRYLASLGRLREEPLDHLRTGHGEDIRDPTGRIDEMLATFEQRTATVLDFVDGPTTAVDVMEELFGHRSVTEYVQGMSEAVGYLDVLEDRGEVAREECGGIVVYE